MFAKDEGNAFYRELHEAVASYFDNKGMSRWGNRKMYFKIRDKQKDDPRY